MSDCGWATFAAILLPVDTEIYEEDILDGNDDEDTLLGKYGGKVWEAHNLKTNPKLQSGHCLVARLHRSL